MILCLLLFSNQSTQFQSWSDFVGAGNSHGYLNWKSNGLLSKSLRNPPSKQTLHQTPPLIKLTPNFREPSNLNGKVWDVARAMRNVEMKTKVNAGPLAKNSIEMKTVAQQRTCNSGRSKRKLLNLLYALCKYITAVKEKRHPAVNRSRIYLVLRL